jgi:membrane dipeptidase
MIIIDGHLDLAMNALLWNRDLTQTVAAIRRSEAGMAQKGRAGGTVALPELRAGRVALAMATLFARTQAPGSPFPGYRSRAIAYGHARGQLAYYRQLEREGLARVIADRGTLAAHLAGWDAGADAPLGLVITMEGADPIVEPEQVAEWWDDGLRVLGLAHYGPSAYAHGTQSSGPLTDRGRALLPLLERLGMLLDLTHLADESFWEALESFGGPVLASHANCRTLVPGDRQLTDDMIRQLIARDAVIGVALDAWMLQPGWVIGATTNAGVGLARVVDHLDHICQLAGNARHAALGTDLDGGYGREQSPHDLDTIADLRLLPPLLRERGYPEPDVEAIMGGNWRRLLGTHLPPGAGHA